MFPKLKNHELLKEKVYKLLKKLILNGDLMPGQKLSQNWIANQMKVSRMPVRQAIERLKTERLIESTHYKESKVANLSHRDIEKIYNIRAFRKNISSKRVE